MADSSSNANRSGKEFDVFIMSSAGGEAHFLAGLNPHDYYAEWTPDGKSVTFSAVPDIEQFSNYIVERIGPLAATRLRMIVGEREALEKLSGAE